MIYFYADDVVIQVNIDGEMILILIPIQKVNRNRGWIKLSLAAFRINQARYHNSGNYPYIPSVLLVTVY